MIDNIKKTVLNEYVSDFPVNIIVMLADIHKNSMQRYSKYVSIK